MPFLTREDLERIANRVIRAYIQLPRISGQMCRNVDPQTLIRDLLGLKIEYHRLSLHGGLLGETCPDSVETVVFDGDGRPQSCQLDGKTILIESALIGEDANVGRLNFTLLHEAAHQIFAMLFPDEYLCGIRRRKIYCCTTTSRNDANKWEEWRANVLASAILMPIDMICRNMQIFGLGDRILRLNRVTDPYVFAQFQSMADYMGVSKKALSVRLQQLGLLEEAWLENPYDFMYVYADKDFDME